MFTLEETPTIFYVGDDYLQAPLEKVCIDWSKRKIRGSVHVKEPEKVKKFHNKIVVLWFRFEDVERILRIY